MPTTLQSLRDGLSAPALKPVYLIAGAEHLLVLEAADALRARARELGFLEREVFDADHHFDWNRLAAAGRSMSLFASRKLIDLRLPTGKPGKDGAAAISAFCDAPPADTVLVVTANDWSGKHEGAWSKAIDRAGVAVIAWPLKPDELPVWVGARFRSRGLDASAEAIEMLSLRTEGNLLAAAQEIDKLAMLHPGARIDLDTLERSVADDARYDVFRLADAALAGDIARALKIVRGLRGEGEEIIAMLGWLLLQLRLLLRVASARGGVEAGLRSEHVWPAARAGLVRRALKRGDAEHWQRCLRQAGKVDAMAKGRPLGDAWRELERLIAAIAVPRAGRALLA